MFLSRSFFFSGNSLLFTVGGIAVEQPTGDHAHGKQDKHEQNLGHAYCPEQEMNFHHGRVLHDEDDDNGYNNQTYDQFVFVFHSVAPSYIHSTRKYFAVPVPM
jgi:hypothetical protein